MDHVKVAGRLSQPEQLANITSEFIRTGGGPYNLLLDLAQTGARFRSRGQGWWGRTPPARPFSRTAGAARLTPVSCNKPGSRSRLTLT